MIDHTEFPLRLESKYAAEKVWKGVSWKNNMRGRTITGVSATRVSGDVTLDELGVCQLLADGVSQVASISGGGAGENIVRFTATFSTGEIEAQDCRITVRV